MPSKITLSRARASLTAAVTGDTLIAAGIYDTLMGSGSNSLVAAANFGYLIAGSGANALVGATQPTSKTAPAFFTTLQGNGQSTLAYNGANNTIILNNSVTGGVALNGFTDYKTDSIIGAQNSSLARSSIIQTSLDKFDLSNTANHGAGVANIRNLVYTGSGAATLHGNNQNNSLLGGTGRNSLSSAGTTGKSTLIAARGLGSNLEGNGLSSLIGSTLGGDLYKISQSVSGGAMRSSDKVFEIATGGNDTLQIATVQGAAAVFDLSNTLLNGKSVLNIENLIYNGTLATSLYGNTGNNLIRGGSGSNFLQGNGGKDTLDASAQNSTLVSATLSASLPSGRNTVTVTSVGGIAVGQTITGTGFAPNTVVTAISGNNLTLSAKTIASVTSGSQIQVGYTNVLVGSANTGGSLIGGSGTNTFNLNNSADTLVTRANSTNNITASSAIFSSPLTRLLSLDFSTLTGNQKFGTISYLGSNPVQLTGGSLGAGSGKGTVIDASLSTGATLGDGGSTVRDSLYGSSKYAGYFITGDLSEVITRSKNNDSLNLTNSNDKTIVDSDFLTTFKGFSSLLLSQGNNSVTAATIAQTVAGLRVLLGGSGNDSFNASTYTNGITMDGGVGNNSLLGGTASDFIRSGTGNDTLLGNEGDDTLDGGGGYDSILAGSGNDLIRFTNTTALSDAITLNGGADNDTLALTSDSLTFDNALFSKVTSVEVLQTANGNNFVALQGNARATGIQTVIGGSGYDTFDASDVAYGSTSVYLDGSTGNDSLIGNLSNDTIMGGSGNDIINGGGGIDSMVGGTGDDTYSVDNSLDRIVENTGSGNDLVYSYANTYELAPNVENLIGRDGSETLIGNTLANSIKAHSTGAFLEGKGGADTLVGSTGGDYFQFKDTNELNRVWSVEGNFGNDTLALTDDGQELYFNYNYYYTRYLDYYRNYYYGYRITGIDFIQMANGNNYVNLRNFDDTFVNLDDSNINSFVSVIGGTGKDTFDSDYNTKKSVYLDGRDGDDLLIGSYNVDTIMGGNGSDTFDGRGGNDSMLGGAGDDSLFGDWGNDTLLGEDGADTLGGGGNNDSLLGGDGSDTLSGTDAVVIGANEVDTLTGGSGADLFVLGDAANVYYNTTSDFDYAVITDFSITDGDKLQLKGSSTDYVIGSLDGTAAQGLNDNYSGIYLGDKLIAAINNTVVTLSTDLEQISNFVV